MRSEVDKSSPLSSAQSFFSGPNIVRADRQFGFLVALIILLATPAMIQAQTSRIAIWGEIKITGEAPDNPGASGVNVILVRVGQGEIARQSISNRGTYRFTDLSSGEYEVVIEADNREVTRARIFTTGLTPFNGYRQDFEFAWKSNARTNPKNDVISAADVYARPSANRSLFAKAQTAVDKKKYDEAVTLLKQILDNDKLDFQVWTLLGTIYQVQEKPEDAERAYLSAIEARPTFALAQMDLGKLRGSQKRFDLAIDPLTRAVEIQPQSADANLLLGEAYLQVKQGSKAVPYLTEAARLGKIEGHLRLAWLYNAAGMKDKAATEYEELLKKKPDYPDRKKLEEYISASKKD